MFGFYRFAAVSPKIKVADIAFNTAEIIKNIQECSSNEVSAVAFPGNVHHWLHLRRFIFSAVFASGSDGRCKNNSIHVCGQLNNYHCRSAVLLAKCPL